MHSARTLLVPLDDEPATALCVGSAIELAARLGSRLVGLAPTGSLDLPAAPASAAGLSHLAAAGRDALHDQASRTAARFRRECERMGLTAFDSVVDESEAAASVLRHALGADLVLVSQPDPKHRAARAATADLDTLVLRNPRPTLVLPHAGAAATIGRRTLVAWDGSREVARAVADALPLLRGAEAVQLVAWGEADGRPADVLRAELATACGWLAGHGIGAEPIVEARPRSIAGAIRAHAERGRCDLIVMGAWGHARWAERVLGGATRSLLRETTVPLLMSH